MTYKELASEIVSEIGKINTSLVSDFSTEESAKSFVENITNNLSKIIKIVSEKNEISLEEKIKKSKVLGQEGKKYE